MANAVNARIQGDNYQANFAWIQICKMFMEYSLVKKVSYETDNIKSFDDVIVYYRDESPLLDCMHNEIYADYYQVKFHVTQNGSFTMDGLMDPSFINATSNSILMRLSDAITKYKINPNNSRFYLVAPWNVDSEDILASLLSNKEGELRLSDFLKNGPSSINGKYREKLKKHLGLKSDEELVNVLKPLRIWFNSSNEQKLIEELNIYLYSIGLKPIDNNSLINPYSELIKKWSLQGIKEFDIKFVLDECKREQLYIDKRQTSKRIPIGVRSFYRRAENMQNETKNMICFIDKFDGRFLKENYSWNNDIYTELELFFNDNLKQNEEYKLILDTHLSIAFSAGRLLDSKSGINIFPIQKTAMGTELWSVEDQDRNIYPGWDVAFSNGDMSSNDTVIIINITHDIYLSACDYLKEKGIQIGKIINCTINERFGNISIINGTHAKRLANSLFDFLNRRTLNEQKGVLHVFSSSPVAFMFFLGQVSRGFGRCILYEYDYEKLRDATYYPSISIN